MRRVIKTFKIEVTDECIGCGACAALCDNFELVEGEKTVAKPKRAEVKELGCNQDAADSCPVSAIKITEQ